MDGARRQRIGATRAGRPAVLGPAVAGRLRERIVAGRWLPGSRLPTRRELCTEFGCSTITLQVAMDALATERFVRSDGRHGTFVSEHPPHLTDVAIIYPQSAAHNHFWDAISETAKQCSSDRHKLEDWRGVDAHEDNPTYCALRERVLQGSLAGLLFVTSPHLFLNSPLLLRPGIARVAIASKWSHAGAPLSTIGVRHESFARRAVERLSRSGCRRLAVVTYPGDPYEPWRDVCAGVGLELRPYWFQGVSQGTPSTGQNLARLLFRDGQTDAPDGVVITDDNLVEAFTQGMADAGANVPREVHVVAHCNFPWPTRSVLPVTRLGIDTRAVLATALGLIEQFQVSPRAERITLDAVFEDEAGAGVSAVALDGVGRNRGGERL